MTDLPQYHHEFYHLSQMSTLTIPYGYDHTKIIGDKEVLFYINCRDGVMIIYAQVDCLFISYEY